LKDTLIKAGILKRYQNQHRKRLHSIQDWVGEGIKMGNSAF